MTGGDALDDSDIRRLRLFLSAVDKGSMRAGAHSLGLKRSSVKSAVDILERRLDAQLLVRARAGVSLTAMGRDVADEARDLLASCDAHLGRIGSMSDSSVRELRVGSIYGFHSAIIERARACEAGYSLNPTVMEIIDPAHEILSGAVDLALLLGPTSKDDELDRYPVGQEIRYAVLRGDHLSGSEIDAVDLATIDQLKWPKLPNQGDMIYLGPWVCADIRGGLPPRNASLKANVFAIRAWLIEGGTVIATTRTIARSLAVENVLDAVPIDVPPWDLDLVVRKGSDLPAAEIAAALRELLNPTV